ncbi:MAG: YceI family protein [Pseudomonadota bacterium]
MPLRPLATTAVVLMTAVSANAADLTSLPAGEYTLDKTHAYITFSYNHLGFSKPHVGFDAFDATLTLDADDPEKSAVSVVIDATSVNSRVATFDEHLNGDDFFATAGNPTITFTSTEIEATGDDTYDITGDLTIKGITQAVTLAATINKAANHPMRRVPWIGMSASTTLLRSDWDLGRYAPNVGDEVSIDIEVEFAKADAD